MAWTPLHHFIVGQNAFPSDFQKMSDNLAFLKNPGKTQIYRTSTVNITATGYAAITMTGTNTLTPSDPTAVGLSYKVEGQLIVQQVSVVNDAMIDFTIFVNGKNRWPRQRIARCTTFNAQRIVTIPIDCVVQVAAASQQTFQLAAAVRTGSTTYSLLAGSLLNIKEIV